jgi:thiol-disulfide isomerase/thioredoxin
VRFIHISLVAACVLTPAFAQQTVDGPANEKAQKTYTQAMQYLHDRHTDWALDAFKKADKEDGGHCLACQRQMIKLGVELGDWKAGELAATEIVTEAQGNLETAQAHYDLARIFMYEGMPKHKTEFFTRAHNELTQALAAYPQFATAVFLDGRALANLEQDDAAKARFEQYLQLAPPGDPLAQRAQRYINHPELARARLAPAFDVTTVDGQRISMDALQGKVVLIDFWATWCGPCRQALPHIKAIAREFQGQPLLILSVSLDDDAQKWKDFIAKNEMTWPQYRDGGFTGPMARLFDVDAIPTTFTIDADGILEAEHVGDASIEGRLKKLIAAAREAQPPQNPPN